MAVGVTLIGGSIYGINIVITESGAAKTVNMYEKYTCGTVQFVKKLISIKIVV